MNFPFLMSVRQRIDYDAWLEQTKVRDNLRAGRVDWIFKGEENWFLRFLCPCQQCTMEVILNTRAPNQSPFYTFFVDSDGTLTVSEQITTRTGCRFWIKGGEILGYEKII